jgi:DNA-directed RNA polymerase subunit RPC12/RpoP
MSSHILIRCPLCGNESARDITTDHRIRMAKENPHDQTQDFDVRFYRCNKCGREFESTEVKKEPSGP